MDEIMCVLAVHIGSCVSSGIRRLSVVRQLFERSLKRACYREQLKTRVFHQCIICIIRSCINGYEK